VAAPLSNESPEAVAEPVIGECPRCGTAYVAGQEYCLECGLRLPVERGVISALGAAWPRRLPYPGDWIWPVLVGLVVAGLATALAIAVRDESGSGTTLVATSPTPAGGITTVPATPEEPAPTVPVEPVEPVQPAAPPPPPAPDALATWPRGTTGWTVVLESIPTTAGRRLAARKARSALAAGLDDVGVLESARYASLHPGYYVVFSGIFPSLGAAQSALSSARAGGYPAAYARQITS
jgi:hypothetical protein